MTRPRAARTTDPDLVVPWAASAPGKVLWTGEYAVLGGAPAVVCAVARRAYARIAAPAARLSPFLDAARREIAAHFGDDSEQARAAARMIVDSSALEHHGRKLGLGSSAASTVSAIAAAIAAGSTDGSADRALIHLLAHRAHGAAQAPRGARGSGADVAASVHGGLLAVQRVPGADDATPLAVRPLPSPPGLTPILIWTGVPADTTQFVARVRALRETAPAAHAAAIGAIAAASAALVDALSAPSALSVPAPAAAAVEAIARGAQALHDLGRTAAAPPLVPPGFPNIHALAAQFHGAAKPTGAGGGDIVLTLFADPMDATAFAAAAASKGMTIVDAAVDSHGVRLAADPESS